MGWGGGHRNSALSSQGPEFIHPLTYYASISLAKAIFKYLEGRMEGKQAGPSYIRILGTSRVRVWRKDLFKGDRPQGGSCDGCSEGCPLWAKAST